MRKLKACWTGGLVVALAWLAASSAAAGGGSGVGRIESTENGTTMSVGNDSNNTDGLRIESVDEETSPTSDASGGGIAGGDRINLMVSAAFEEDDSGLPAPEKKAFTVGERTTVFKDTYTVSFIDEMRINEQGDREPVVKDVAFGRWLEISVREAGDDGVTATVYFVRKRPVNVDPNADGPQMELPEAGYDMVSRDVRLTPGRRERLRIHGDNGPLGLQLGMSR